MMPRTWKLVECKARRGRGTLCLRTRRIGSGRGDGRNGNGQNGEPGGILGPWKRELEPDLVPDHLRSTVHTVSCGGEFRKERNRGNGIWDLGI
jgi:hypothetical protein